MKKYIPIIGIDEECSAEARMIPHITGEYLKTKEVADMIRGVIEWYTNQIKEIDSSYCQNEKRIDIHIERKCCYEDTINRLNKLLKDL